EAGLIPRLLGGLVGGVQRWPRLVLALGVVLCALSAYTFYSRLEIRTQRTDLVRPNKDYLQRWRQYVEEVRHEADSVVVETGSDRPRMEQALESLAGALQAQPQFFDRLFYKVDLRHLRNRALLFLPTKQIEEIRRNIQSMGLLLEPPVVSQLDPYV